MNETDMVSAYPDLMTKIVTSSLYGKLDLCWKCVWAIMDYNFPVSLESRTEEGWTRMPGHVTYFATSDAYELIAGRIRYIVESDNVVLPMIAMCTVENHRVCQIHLSRRLGGQLGI